MARGKQRVHLCRLGGLQGIILALALSPGLWVDTAGKASAASLTPATRPSTPDSLTPDSLTPDTRPSGPALSPKLGSKSKKPKKKPRKKAAPPPHLAYLSPLGVGQYVNDSPLLAGTFAATQLGGLALAFVSWQAANASIAERNAYAAERTAAYKDLSEDEQEAFKAESLAQIAHDDAQSDRLIQSYQGGLALALLSYVVSVSEAYWQAAAVPTQPRTQGPRAFALEPSSKKWQLTPVLLGVAPKAASGAVFAFNLQLRF